MSSRSSAKAHKPRELRRRVIAAARLRRARGWSDATILNISSRGMQIQTSWPLDKGAWIELRCGQQVMRAQVVWHEGVRAGLRTEECLAVEEIAAGEVGRVRSEFVERRLQPRPEDRNRLRGRAIEFAGVLSVAVILAAGLLADFQQSFAKPLAVVAAVLR